MYRLCFGTIMTILYQARSHKVTNKTIFELKIDDVLEDL